MEHQLQVVRRKMLRYVFRIHRLRDQQGTLEGWVDFVQSSAHRVDVIASHHGMEDWVVTHRRRKWRFAGSLARQTDGRWSRQAIGWRPNMGHGRSQGRPRTRWSDQLEQFAGGEWFQLAMDEEQWQIAEEVFVKLDR